MSKYNRTKLLPYGLRFIQGVVRGNTRFEIKGASFGVTQVTDNDVINAGKLPNIVGSIPIVAIDDDSLASQGVLGIELSFTQKSTGINHDVTLWDVQINGQQERDNQERPIAYTIAQQPESLTLSDPSFEFRLMVYVQVGDTDKVTINVNQDGMESRAEHARDFNRLIKSISEGYIDVDLKDHNGNQVYDSQGRIIKVKHAIVDTDKSLSILGRAADAKKVGEVLGAIDSQLRTLDQLLHTNYSTTLDLQDVKNIAAANADINNRQDGQINGLITKTNEIESGVINNARTIGILSHDGKSLATHANAAITARTEYIKTDSALSDYSAVANAGKVGEAIKQTFLILNASINQLAADYNSLQSNQVIVDLTNQVLALKDQVSAFKDQNDVAQHYAVKVLKKSLEISDAQSQKDNLDALHDPGRYYLGDANGYKDAVLEVATLGSTDKVMQYIFDAGNNQDRSKRRIGTKSGDSYSWSEWNNEY
ncbi:MAG: hypothetical protein L0H95_00570 [Lactobacillus sp.]|uniref:hypothetical protein n=1 Tax=Lactobacillus sp. TaxID=1591 RepID=UPI002648D296|nr:hypothetical protein [Lactobacillus sp.]MDN5988585.1 hypothetical protein [Lactobacillus sp.]MDN6007635.1 hypothetical protein [Lactobacillus sp.]MDN6653346.1 hypothetical protein [Lactobacillus sp.]